MVNGKYGPYTILPNIPQCKKKGSKKKENLFLYVKHRLFKIVEFLVSCKNTDLV
uniref:Uncharacterized protein n=1 Tax=Arion vulgaris TaxID=1028688 RepID=A0A0B7BGM5_9EUPU